MRLQRLEIAGFKSFPDRSELTFDQGVTAIVGPNGCGKSNVVDALTWVLGEQSAKSLRGDRMEDVIFGGSDARKPTAAAEVRLRLGGVAARVPGNAVPVRRPAPLLDGDAPVMVPIDGEMLVAGAVAVDDEAPLIVRDVELMRRLYRSGESEYLIDGESCRLRDVQDLLMDAGLGIKAYAVIEQGKIGQILSARPTDRRQLIEEAAGVTKYKSRRRAAELKLEAAQQNLTRVDDIIFEVEKQRGTLKRQAAKARRYKRLREQLRRWEKVQFAQRYRLLGEAIESARTRLADARAREAAAAAHVAELDSTLERLRLELTEADGQTTAAREAAHHAELENGRLQQQIAFDKQQVQALGAAGADIEADVRALEARREPARLELDARREAAGARGERSRARRRDAQRRRGRLRRPAAQHRRARGGRRGGAQRGVRCRERRDSAAPRRGTRGSLARAHGRTDHQARGREPRPARRSRTRGRGARGRGRGHGARRGRPWIACGSSVRRASPSSPGRGGTARGGRWSSATASANSPASWRGSSRSKSWTPHAPSTATAPASCWPSRRPTSPRWDRWPTTSRSRGSTSAPWRRASATSSSTSSCARTSRPPPACASRRSATRGA